jgi:tetratricopeptide (TPR) repeat protein
MDEEQRNGLVIQADRAYQDAVANPAAGRRSAKRVADDARTAGNPEALVVALRAAGWAARELYDHESAQRYLDEAVDVARDAGLDDRLCEVLITRASTHLEVGNDRQARRDLAAARTVAGHQASAEVAFAHGLLEDETGNYSAALSAYRRTLELVADDRPHLRVKT